MSRGVRKLRLLLLVEGRAPSRACPERSRRAQAERSSARFFPLSTPSHPERSRIMREAHDPAESKDPYTVCALISAARHSHDAAALGVNTCLTLISGRTKFLHEASPFHIPGTI